MVRIVIKLLIAVSVTDRAKSPFAKCVIKFEVGPPGQAAKINIPIAISGCSGNRETNPKPISGSIII